MNDSLDEGGQGALNSASTLPNAIPDHELGHAVLTPTGDFEAGSWQTFQLVYTCGKYGMDDSASLRVCFRFASDQSRPQFDAPDKPNYTTIQASNNAVLEYRYDPKGNVRPWDRCLYIKVVNGFMAEGDTITITFGETSGGSKGMRIQTFCEESFEFRVLVDPIATANYQTLPEQPMINIVSGPPANFAAVLPTERLVGQAFTLKVKGEDRWGNPSDKCDQIFHVKSNTSIDNLPETITLTPGSFSRLIENLSVQSSGLVNIWFESANGQKVFRANPLLISENKELLPFWVDLHGQSEETIGTGSARDYFNFARDKAFVDATAHQGNDFQITKAFWAHLNELCELFDEPGRFVVPHGYEWSGNTALGGDRNVFFPNKGRTIRRSSHALLEDHSDIDTDCNTAAEFFETLVKNDEWDVLGYAHCGGRYADIKQAHDGRFEKSMEVHSSWGTFEWLIQDALDLGYRIGIVGNSDGHKGRPGASYPGASMFGAIGGLTCMLMPELTREALLDCIRKRRHYATTGGNGGRMIIDVTAKFDTSATIYHDDPALDYPVAAQGHSSDQAMIGDIVHLPEGEAELQISIKAAAPIERLDIFNGRELIETVRPYAEDTLGKRIRLHWEGAEYRGRFRQVIWDGTAEISGNQIQKIQEFNFFNPEKGVDLLAPTSLAWSSLTTGNFAGFDMWLEDKEAGILNVETPIVKFELPIQNIGYDDQIFDQSGDLPRFMKVLRLPDENSHHTMDLSRIVKLSNENDNPLYIRLTQEDGTRAWTSPIYVCRQVR